VVVCTRIILLLEGYLGQIPQRRDVPGILGQPPSRFPDNLISAATVRARPAVFRMIPVEQKNQGDDDQADCRYTDQKIKKGVHERGSIVKENIRVVKFNGTGGRPSREDTATGGVRASTCRIESEFHRTLTKRLLAATISFWEGRGGALNGQQIGIKLADGSFYPVLSEDDRLRKKLVLTTVRDNQETVQIDLFRGEGELAEGTDYIGTLMIENIQPAPMKEPEVEVVLGVDERGNLEATASDALTGESQSLSVSLQSLSQGPADYPEFELEREGAGRDDFEETLLTGETYPISDADRRKEHLGKKRRRPLLLIAFIILSLILIAAITFIVFKAVGGTPIPALFSGTREPSSAAQSQEAAEPSQVQPAAEPPAEQVPSESETSQVAQRAAPREAQPESPGAGEWYNIKWGDTLWDIAGTYYRNPWLYPKIARENGISNPDLIIAGTRIFIPEN
jgi:nucleoid-associated protein YgaU